MGEIEISGKSDHDLLVIAVTQINAANEKLDGVCTQVARHERQLTILQTEHNERKDFCASPAQSNWREKAAMGGIGGVIGAAIASSVTWLINNVGRG